MALATMEFRHARLDWSRVYIAGVLNVTPDSFSDGGLYQSADAAVERGLELARQGADILDIGGESTRPGAAPVDAATEIARVVPVIERLAARVRVPLSIDTTKAAVARAALAAGAEIVNDVSGGLFDPAIVAVTAAAGAAYICGHVRGTTLAQVHAAEIAPPTHEDVTLELAARVASLPVALRHRTMVDPGLGFGKTLAENLELSRRAGELGLALGCPVMLGPSRKRFIRTLVQPSGRTDSLAVDSGTVGACLAAVACGAHLVRAHNIELLKPTLMVYEAITGFSS
jgi:dihydropteroate synthase